VDITDAREAFGRLIERASHGEGVVITRDGHPVAKLGPAQATIHRRTEPRRAVTLPPEFEPGDARLARLEREGEIPYRLRELPRH
jgi:prevent-host-death family protein